nr:proline-rich protein 15-like protein isoform X1 [Columba livia]
MNIHRALARPRVCSPRVWPRVHLDGSAHGSRRYAAPAPEPPGPPGTPWTPRKPRDPQAGWPQVQGPVVGSETWGHSHGLVTWLWDKEGTGGGTGAVAMAESHGWWKLTFLRKRRSVPTVLYESPDSHGAGDTTEGTGEGGPPGYAARLEKIVDKSTKGKHVKVSNSGRFKEKKKVRATLAEHPNLCGAGEQEDK